MANGLVRWIKLTAKVLLDKKVFCRFLVRNLNTYPFEKNGMHRSKSKQSQKKNE